MEYSTLYLLFLPVCLGTSVNVRMSHYSRLYDIQTLAMLSCVFGSKQRRATSNVQSSSSQSDRHRGLSQTAANTAADVTPANVCTLLCLYIPLYISITHSIISFLPCPVPPAGIKNSPIHLPAGCHKRQLNQALSVLSLFLLF